MPHDFKLGDFAYNIESNWFGKIVAFEVDSEGDPMAKMVGVDELARLVGGLSREAALSPDDVQWHDLRDLVPSL